jgi:hypothetical protein
MLFRTFSRSILAALVITLPAALAACASDGAEAPGTVTGELRGLDRQQALAELGEVGDAIRAFYGPLEFKKTRFGFDLDAALATAKEAIEGASTEADRVRPIFELLAKLKDAHVSITYPLLGDQTTASSLPVILTPVEGSTVVAAALPSTGLTRGDKIVSIDGTSVTTLAERFAPLVGMGPADSVAHLTALYMTVRPFYAPRDLQPLGASAEIVAEHADGTALTVQVPWIVTPGGLANQVRPATQGSRGSSPTATLSGPAAALLQHSVDGSPAGVTLLEEGASRPFFLTGQVQAATGMVEVTPKMETLTRFGVTVPDGDADAPDADRFVWLRAYKYKHAGKTVLLVRIPSFITPKNNYAENVGWLAALLTDNLAASPDAASLADAAPDVAVLDDTHNPGGDASYVAGLASLFAPRPIGNLVQAFHADRSWISHFIDAANQSNAAEQAVWLDRIGKIETAIDAGNPLSVFLPLAGTWQGPTVPASVEADTGADLIQPYPGVHWDKPVLVLHDELSGSGGDAFPALLKSGGVAKTFGKTTMGAGGSVEEVATLSFSRAKLNLTRGLMGPYVASGSIKLIEDDGVSPDFPYTHTLADFRAGYVAFVNAFSDAAVSLTTP